jgi:hypothetical protein
MSGAISWERAQEIFDRTSHLAVLIERCDKAAIPMAAVLLPTDLFPELSMLFGYPVFRSPDILEAHLLLERLT